MQTYLGGKVVVKVGDITKEDVDVIVNAANHTLLGGGGVDGAIHRAAGPYLRNACEEICKTEFPAGLPEGEAVITPGFNLKAKVIHTVGPVWGSGSPSEKDEKLRSCYINSLKIAQENACTTIAFPAISTGVYHFPKERAAKVSSKTIRDYLRGESSISQVRLVFFSDLDAKLFCEHQSF